MLRRSIAGTDSDCVLVSQRQGNIKIDQDNISVRPAHNIGRFDISMKITDSSVSARKRVKVMQGREDLNRDPDHIRLRKDHSIPQRSVQTVALNIVHCCIGDTIFDKIIVYPGDIRMIQILQDIRFPPEKPFFLTTASLVCLEHDRFAQSFVFSEIYISSAA